MPVKSISIDELTIDAHFRYSLRARHLSLRLSQDNKLEVVLPPGYNLAKAESFLHQRTNWIKKHLNKVPSFPFIYLGKRLNVIQTYDLFTKHHTVQLDGDKFLIASPSGSRLKADKLFEVWLKDIAKNYLPLRAAELAAEQKVSFKGVSIRGQKTRWGSCSAKKNLSFNYRLMKYRKEVIDYVIIHELCHLVEMNHSYKFWKLVAKACPDYKKLIKELKN